MYRINERARENRGSYIYIERERIEGDIYRERENRGRYIYIERIEGDI